MGIKGPQGWALDTAQDKVGLWSLCQMFTEVGEEGDRRGTQGRHWEVPNRTDRMDRWAVKQMSTAGKKLGPQRGPETQGRCSHQQRVQHKALCPQLTCER